MKQIVLVLSLLFGITAFSAAQTGLTLEKAVQIAIDRNTTVVQARNTVDTRQSSTEAAYGALLPTLGLSGDWNWTRSKSTFYNGIQVGSGTETTERREYSAGIGANVTLFNGFANTSGIDEANYRETASRNDLSQTVKNAIFQTHTLYLTVFKMYQLLLVSQDNLKTSQQQLARIVESNNVGSVALADVYRQRVQVGSDELLVIQAQNNFDKAKTDLYAYLAIDTPGSMDVDFQGIASDIDTTEFTDINARYSNLDNLLNQATQNRPDYLSAVQSVSAANSGITIAQSGYLPSLSGNANYGYQNTDLTHLTDNSSLSFGLTLSYPIFSGFQTKTQTQQAIISKNNAEEVLSQTRRQIRADLQKALLDFNAWQKQISVTKTSVESADMDRQIAQEKYTLGAGTLLDELTAQANYTTAVTNKVNAVIGYLLSKKQLEFTIGTITK